MVYLNVEVGAGQCRGIGTGQRRGSGQVSYASQTGEKSNCIIRYPGRWLDARVTNPVSVPNLVHNHKEQQHVQYQTIGRLRCGQFTFSAE